MFIDLTRYNKNKNQKSHLTIRVEFGLLFKTYKTKQYIIHIL